MKTVSCEYPLGTKECPSCEGRGHNAPEEALELIRQIPLAQRRGAIQMVNVHYGTCEDCDGKGYVENSKENTGKTSA